MEQQLQTTQQVMGKKVILILFFQSLFCFSGVGSGEGAGWSSGGRVEDGQEGESKEEEGH